MQVTETSSEGLKREFRVVVPAADLEARLNDRLAQLKDRVRLNGFRPGKVPVAHLKKVYGRSVMAEAIDELVRDTNTKIVTDNGYKLAMDPKVTLPEDKGEIENIIAGQADLAYSVAIEVVPKIELADFSTISLEKLVADVSETEISDSLSKIADQNKPYLPKGEGAKAESGDRVMVSFTGSIDGKPFEGGSGEDVGVNIGSGTFIPGFEEQLIGIAAGETRTVNVTFPSNYLSEQLAGKAASFEVTAKSVDAAGTIAIDDEFAKTLGLESLDKLRELVKERIEREYANVSRLKLKRALLDKLDEMHKFEAPPTMVEQEFEGVWATVLSDLKTQNRSFADEGTDEDKAKAEYRTIADRRVRLGLVLSEIGDKNSIKVTDEEMQRAIVDRARQFPGREKEVWEHFRNNPNSLASLRAPIFEEKVVDFIIELAKPTEKKVSREDLFRDDEEEGGKAA
jgi:trigger factor